MSINSYTPASDFSTLTGEVIDGADFDTEFSAISTAFANSVPNGGSLSADFAADQIDCTSVTVTGTPFGFNGGLRGDVYNSAGVKILENGTALAAAEFTGNVTGDVTGNVTGNVTGDVYSSGDDKILESGTDGTDAYFIGNLRSSNGTSVVANTGTDGTDAYFKGDIKNESNAVVVDISAVDDEATFIGNLTGNITGDVTGNIEGNVVVTGTSETFDIVDVSAVDPADGTGAVFNGNLAGNATTATALASGATYGISAYVFFSGTVLAGTVDTSGLATGYYEVVTVDNAFTFDVTYNSVTYTCSTGTTPHLLVAGNGVYVTISGTTLALDVRVFGSTGIASVRPNASALAGNYDVYFEEDRDVVPYGVVSTGSDVSENLIVGVVTLANMNASYFTLQFRDQGDNRRDPDNATIIIQ